MNVIKQPDVSTRITAGSELAPILSVQELCVDVISGGSDVRLVDQFSLDLRDGERVALVGESGSGKSVTARAIMQLNPSMRASGRIEFKGEDILQLPERSMRNYRGSQIGMVFQDPMAALNPLMTIGEQVMEPLRVRGISAAKTRARAIQVLDDLGVDKAKDRLRAYPHEFSGGMRQRVVLAIALIGDPSVLIADEPTTALDVRVQEQVLKLLDHVAQERGLTVLIITHDLGIVAGFAERVAVMYSGRKVEEANVQQIFASPRHPYTRGLLRAVPRLDKSGRRLEPIPGAPPSPLDRPSGCTFHPRCELMIPRCPKEYPATTFGPEGAQVECHVTAYTSDDSR